jgi:hypothetical protein
MEAVSYFELYQAAKATCVRAGTGTLDEVRNRASRKVRACCYCSFDAKAKLATAHLGSVRWDSDAKAFVDVPTGTLEDNGAPIWLVFQSDRLIREAFRAFRAARDQFPRSRSHWLSLNLPTGELLHLSRSSAWARLADERTLGPLASGHLVILLNGTNQELAELMDIPAP